MRLTRTERWIIANQLRILEILYPDEAKAISYDREAIERGYPLHYDDAASHAGVYDEALGEGECIEVLNILSMFRAIHFSKEKLADRTGIEEWQVEFDGFDGNEETGQLAYTEWYCERGAKFAELHRRDGFNSHSPRIEVYRRMLEEWEASKDKHALSKEDIIRIGRATVHPSRRGTA